ncbi:4-oxalmesaconate hydratase [Candidatus Rubidus massiliensis]|nr:4-oxalmesaconate hydratase [Candidatus Rubidus massiliensis]
MYDVMVVGSHPDDIEFGCGGIVCKLVKEGKKVVLVDLTLGDKGTNGNPEIRKKEASKAAELLGVDRFFLDFNDCEVIDNYDNRLKIAKIIRECRPSLIIAPPIQKYSNHPDHSATAELIRIGARYARFKKILPELPVHFVKNVLHYIHVYYDKVDFIIDVTSHVDEWKKMMECHASQMATYPFVDRVLRFSSYLGVLIERPYAQGLISLSPVVIEDVTNLSQGIREI